MSKNVALIHEGVVVNLAVFDDSWDEVEWNGYSAVPVGEHGVGIGWQFDGENFIAPPQSLLSVLPDRILPNQKATAYYANTFKSAPTQVVFDVNGSTSTVSLTEGVAELEITPSGLGPIEVSVNQDVPSVTIMVVEG